MNPNSSSAFEQVVQENEKLKIALGETKNKLDEKVNDLQISRESNEEMKRRIDYLEREFKDLESKYVRQKDEKEAMENTMRDDFRRIQDKLSKKEREMAEIQSKYLNFVDFDLEQKKIENKLELKYGKALEEKQRQIDEMNRAMNDVVRDHEIAKAKLNAFQSDHERDIGLLKDNYKRQIDTLLQEISELQQQKLANDFKDRYNEMRVKKEEGDKKNQLLTDELERVKAENSVLKGRHNQVMLESSREADKIRSDLWNHKSEKDKLA